MPNTILTPVTLWKDFDETLPFNENVLTETREDGAIVREVAFSGRNTGSARVRIFATYAVPEDKENFPAVMVLFEAGLPFDMKFVKRLIGQGYGVLCVDYCGENGTGKYTAYPEEADYANFMRAGRHIEYAEPTARETSWYEWAGVARYAARWLSERPEVTKVGAIGLRTGGEVLFKIAPYAPISCMISVCAAGWLAYRGVERFTDGEKPVFDEERHRFIAGIDSQSYAPYVKCPVLLLSAINDKKYNYDRVYDTFQQINPEVEKAILFSAHGNGLIGSHSLANLYLFLDKYLKGRSVFVSRPISLTIEEDEEGRLVAKGTYDAMGEIEEYGIFYTERAAAFKTRDWTRVLGKAEDLAENEGTVPLGAYEGSDKLLAYTFVRYSNGFSVTSKIQEFALKKQYKNSRYKSRVLYSSADGMNGFTAFRRRARSIADCFADGSSSDVRLVAGYGGIRGITADAGLVSYRVGESRYEPPEGASIRFDAWSEQDARLKIIFYKDAEENVGYSCEETIEGGGKWKSILLDAGDFKSETGAPLRDFSGVVSLVFFGDGEILVNNVIWI